MQLGSPHDEAADPSCSFAYRRRNQRSEAYACEDCHYRGDEYVDSGLLAHHLADLCCKYGHDVHCEGTAGSAEQVGDISHRDERVEHHAGGTDGTAYGGCHRRTCHGGGYPSDGESLSSDGDYLSGQEAYMELTADGVEDGADKKGAEEPLRHGGHGVDAVPLQREDDVLSLKECFDGHGLFLLEFVLCRECSDGAAVVDAPDAVGENGHLSCRHDAEDVLGALLHAVVTCDSADIDLLCGAEPA